MNGSGPPATRDSLPQVAVALLIAAFVLMHTWEDLERSFGSEFYQNWVVAQEIHTGNARQIYSAQWQHDIGQKYWRTGHSDRATKNQLVASDAHRTLDTYSTPLAFSMIDLLSTSNYAHSLQVFRIIQFSCGIIAIALLCRLLEYSWTATILAVTVLWGWGETFLADIYAADISQIQLLLIALMAWIESRGKGSILAYLSGILLAIIVALQPQLITIPLLLFAASSKHRLLRRSIAFVITLIALLSISSFTLESSHCWIDWIGALREVWMRHSPISANNASLVEILRENLGPITSSALAIALLIAVFLLVPSIAKKFVQPVYAVVAIGSALPLLIWPISRHTDFVLAAPVLLFTFRPTNDSLNAVIPRWTVGAVGLLLFCNSQLTTNILWLDDPLGIAARLAGSTLVFFCLAFATTKPGPSGSGALANTPMPNPDPERSRFALTSTAPASGSATSET